MNLQAEALVRRLYQPYGDVIAAGPALPSASANAGTARRFVPMGGARRYLVVVCEGADAPDLATLKAFIAGADQGITYRPGIWHHPLIALDRTTDFACLVHEDGTSGDGEICVIAPSVSIIY